MEVARSLASFGGGKTAAAAVVAIGLHAGLLGVLEWQRSGPVPERWLPRWTTAVAPPDLSSVELAPGQVTTVALIRDLPTGLYLPRIAGAGDQDGTGDQHPFPDAAADFPGRQPAARGGGTGGTEMFGADPVARTARAEVWNNTRRYRSPRQAAARVGGGQPLRRTPVPGFDAATRRAREARPAAPASSSGSASVPVSPGLSATVVPSGPLSSAATAAGDTTVESSARRPQSPASPAQGLARSGAPTAPATGREPGGDHHEVSAASDTLDPLPIELAAPRTGSGDGFGAAADSRATGAIARGWTHRGTAATSAHIGAGNRRTAIEASREDPYFRRMYRRIDQVVVFPRRLAIAMEQGEVVARFTLFADGRIGNLEIAKPSGFEDFDKELVRALEAVAPFGQVPGAVLQGRDRVTVVTPYTFRNALIR